MIAVSIAIVVAVPIAAVMVAVAIPRPTHDHDVANRDSFGRFAAIQRVEGRVALAAGVIKRRRR